MEIPDISSPKILCFYQIYKICIIISPRIFLFLSHLSIHKKIEYLLPKLTTEVERREWDSNLEAVVRGLYSMSDFTNVSLKKTRCRLTKIKHRV